MESPATHVYIFGNVLWMSWNAMLALLPFLLSFILFKKTRKINVFWLVGFLIYFAFLPNAPYILTDVVHLYTASLEVASNKLLFFTTQQYVLFLVIGCYLFGESYARFEHFIALRAKRLPFLTIRFGIFLILSLGVYLGRFLRLNSWDIVLNPLLVIESLKQLLHIHTLLYTALFTLLLYLIYFLFERVHIQTHPHLHTHRS